MSAETFPTPFVYDISILMEIMDEFLSAVINGDDANLSAEAQRVRDLLPPSWEQMVMVELPAPTEKDPETAIWKVDGHEVQAMYVKGYSPEVWVKNVRTAVRDPRGVALALLAATDRNP